MPTQAVVKRLFALSGNLCAFPKCGQPLIHQSKVTGRICHIRAASPNGPRFDSTQSELERHSFDNLVLLCPIHHDVVDADERAYTVERLLAMKSDHERTSIKQGSPLDDETAQQLIGNVSVTGGSIVITQNQSGGQAANIINNYGPIKRTLRPTAIADMLTLLLRHKGSTIGFASTHGSSEAHGFKHQLMAVFQHAGWNVSDLQTFMFFEERLGLVVTIPFGRRFQVPSATLGSMN